MWHVTIVGAGGVLNTLHFPYVNEIRGVVYDPLRFYTRFIDHDYQNWGFFSFVPGNIVRISFATLNAETNEFTEIEEYKLTAPPYFGRQNLFNFARSIAEEDERYNKVRNRYILWYCEQNNIENTTVYMRLKSALLPAEAQLHYYDWRNFTPEWHYTTVGDAYCPTLS